MLTFLSCYAVACLCLHVLLTCNVSFQMAVSLRNKGIDVISGWKLCRNCYQKVKEGMDVHEDDLNNHDDNDCDDDDCEVNEFETSAQIEERRDMLNESFGVIGISPLKTHGVKKITKVKAAREKLERSFEKQKEMVKEIYHLPDTSELETSSSTTVDKEMKSKAANFDRLMFLMKEKLDDKSLKMSKKIQVLTMAPDWSRASVAQLFYVTEYIVREVRRLVKEKGILALPDSKRGKFLSKELE